MVDRKSDRAYESVFVSPFSTSFPEILSIPSGELIQLPRILLTAQILLRLIIQIGRPLDGVQQREREREEERERLGYHRTNDFDRVSQPGNPKLAGALGAFFAVSFGGIYLLSHRLGIVEPLKAIRRIDNNRPLLIVPEQAAVRLVRRAGSSNSIQESI